MELDAIVAKVQRGERLSPSELAALRAAPPSRRSALALAHALIELEAPRDALSLLEALARARRDDAEVHLARARALLLLERMADAEDALHAALRLSPEDPETLKVLAVLSLRRGEQERAKALVTRVLERDPFDAEAQLLSAELDASSGPPAPITPSAPLPDFLTRLTFALKARGVAVRRQGALLLLKPRSGPVARLRAQALHARYVESGLSLDAAVGQLADELAAQPGEFSREVLLERVLPLVRPLRFGSMTLDLLVRSHPAHFTIAYAVADGAYLRFLTSVMARRHGLSLDELDEAAWQNLSPCALLPLVHDGATLHRLEGSDPHDTARLLLPAQLRAFEATLGPSPWRARATREFGVVLTREDSLDGRRALAHLDFDEALLDRDLLLPLE